MIFKIPECRRISNINITDYLIDWNSKIKRGKHFGKLQFEVKQLLKKFWEKEIVLEEFKIPRSNGKSLDIVNLTRKICCEIQGSQHSKQIDFFHRNKFHFFKQIESDLFKEEFCRLNDIKYIQIYQEDILNEETLTKLELI